MKMADKRRMAAVVGMTLALVGCASAGHPTSVASLGNGGPARSETTVRGAPSAPRPTP